MRCLHCNDIITSKYAKKFCSSSCSASYNNNGVTRNIKKERPNCLICGNKVSKMVNKFCSTKCAGLNKNKYTIEERKRLNCEKVMAYRARKKNQTPSNANKEKIKEFYLNCPKGLTVDHIIPLSKGGLHHEDNLQYLSKSENSSKNNKLNWKKSSDNR